MDSTIDQVNPHTLLLLKHKIFYVLAKLEAKNKQRFTIREIVEYLIDKLGITTSRQAVEYALGSDRKATHKNNAGYRLMKHGRDQLTPKTNQGVMLIEPGKPFSGKKLAAENVLSKLKGEVRICDAYCGVGLLNLIYKSIDKNTSIKILTQKIIDKPIGIFSGSLMDLRKEGFQVEIKVYTSSYLHDRYVIDSHNLWLSGNSFNDLGNRESFIVLLGADIRQSVLATFNTRWKSILNSI